jgi:hypothetical protein
MRNGDGQRRHVPLRGGGDGMSIAANIIAGILATVAVGLALRASRLEGEKAGYDRGFREGHSAADQWWMGLERESDRMRETMRSNEERWP